MNATIRNFIARNSVFAWIALGTGLVLLVPLVAMRFTDAVAWSAMDFVVMGALLFAAGFAYELISRRLKTPAQRWLAGLGILVMVVLVWVELAVGALSQLFAYLFA